MAEKTTFDPRVLRATEAHSRRLPFAPIFDTIVAERLPESPLTSEEPATKVFAPPEEGNGFCSLRTPERQNRPDEPLLGHVAGRGNLLAWIVAAGLLLLVVGVVLQNIQLARQENTLSQLAQGTSKLAKSMSDARAQEQRPWVTLSDLLPQPLSIAPGSFSVTLQNTGKTPAVDVKVSATAQLIGVPNASALPAIEPVNRAAGTLFPGAQFRTILDFRPTAAVFTALFREQGQLEVHLSASYEDVQRNSHVTQSCWHWRPAMRQIEPCSTFGTVN